MMTCKLLKSSKSERNNSSWHSNLRNGLMPIRQATISISLWRNRARRRRSHNSKRSIKNSTIICQAFSGKVICIFSTAQLLRMYTTIPSLWSRCHHRRGRRSMISSCWPPCPSHWTTRSAMSNSWASITTLSRWKSMTEDRCLVRRTSSTWQRCFRLMGSLREMLLFTISILRIFIRVPLNRWLIYLTSLRRKNHQSLFRKLVGKLLKVFAKSIQTWKNTSHSLPNLSLSESCRSVRISIRTWNCQS